MKLLYSPLGLVHDMTGGFATSFIIHGAAIILSATVLLPITLQRLFCSRNEDIDTEMQSETDPLEE